MFTELEILLKSLDASYGWFTRGGSETIGISKEEKPCFCDSLEKTVVDTVGAGDAFSAIASLSAASNLPVELATLFGQVAGALAVKIVGNSSCISKSSFLKGVEAMFKL